ncbi:M48 family metallopeptidase [Campylobacter cuniculorum]|uniref:M48 family metallopeptidase n=2 Tax=Campylobacter cuniculorum TaxID=374106 RepID=A0ABX6TXQ1_9BACT|nr:SprT family zinc-dependent metalloprotease [Campylobacter cuniculorum]ARJ56354.1 putative metal-dependent hydrolase (DUF45 domain) [Campylobacter cuniculorum DSM 23162 = LMG 24588]QOR03842.1 M48 family metallopeptidase [Campylobacter cuniculorum]
MINDVLIIKKDVKNIILKVKPNGEASIIAPKDTSDEYIQKILVKRADWIEQKRERFLRFQKKEKAYISGESLSYLGRQYKLKIIQANEECVKLQRNYLEVYVKNTDDIKLRKSLIEQWYHQRALVVFDEIFTRFNQITKKEVKKFAIRKMKTRWGSCNAFKSYIHINSELIKKPKICIEYVIFHELTHMIFPNHSKNFYNYLSYYMRDWKERKECLENYNKE